MNATKSIALLLLLLAFLAPSASGNASQSQSETGKAQPASSTADCNQQTWPIINAACLHSASNAPVQSVRVVSPAVR